MGQSFSALPLAGRLLDVDAHPFYSYNLWVVQIIVSLVLFAAALIGQYVGRLESRRIGDTTEIGLVQTNLLGILGLLLGFTFAVSSTRYDQRRVLAIDEANALGTTFMRAQMLQEPYRTRLSDKLHRYIDLRARTSELVDKNVNIADLRRETENLQQAIWRDATALARVSNTELTSLFASSLNQSIDLYASRVATFLARVPPAIMWILFLIAIVAVGMVGYGFGLAGQRGWLTMALVSVTVAAVMIMIIDLDKPEAGPTRISQQTMIDLSKSLSGYQSGSIAGR